MFGSSRCQPLNIINLWRAVSVIHLLYNSSINIGVTANKNMFSNNVQTLSQMFRHVRRGVSIKTSANHQVVVDVGHKTFKL